MTAAALAGLKVVDLSEFRAGPYCTKLLAGFGAQVIKIERPGTGDPLRQQGPFAGDRPDPEHSIPYLWLGTGKLSLALDLTDPRGQALARRLCTTWADVVVESFAPGVLDRLGLGCQALRAESPGLVWTSITGFGQTGPYRDYQAEEMTFYALSGQMNATGDPDREPLAPGTAINQYTAGLHAYIGTLLALRHREKTGLGQQVDIAILEGGIDHIEIAVANWLHEGVASRRSKHLMVPWRDYPCQDGLATVICAPFRNWLKGAQLFEAPELLAPRFHHVRGRHLAREEVEALIAPWLATKTRQEIFQAGQARGLAFGYVASLPEVLALPQLAARGFLTPTPDGRGGIPPYAGAPFVLSATPWQQGRAPFLGEHTRPVLAGILGLTAAEIEALVAAGVAAGPVGTGGFSHPGHPSLAPPSPSGGRLGRGAAPLSHVTGGPLAGIRILDLTHSWAGPHGTRILADCGAEVIKIEYLPRLCLLRGGIVAGGMYNQRPMWRQVNRGKRSITLDLDDPRDRASFLDLVRLADVVAENSRGGVLARRGLDYTGLARVKPDIILLSMAAFGHSGPWAGYAGYGATMEALSGLATLTGYRDGSGPKRIRELDVANGICGAAAVLTALAHRDATGRGQWIDLSQLETAAHALVGEHLLEYAMTGRLPEPRGNRHRFFAPSGCYPCAGEDRWVTLAVRSDAEWQRLGEVLGEAAWAGQEHFATAAGRMARHDEIDRRLAAWTRARSPREAMTILQQAGIAAGAVSSVADLAADPHLAARGFFAPAAAGDGQRYPGNPIRLGRGGSPISWPGPDLGRDNAHVFGTLLGRPPAEIPVVREDRIGTALDP
ncbi:MAG: CoA transferase [Thermodesulfobacteriota bacterium]